MCPRPIISKKDCKTIFKGSCGGGGGGGSGGGGGTGGELKVKVVSYNLYWWNAFGQRPGRPMDIAMDWGHCLGWSVFKQEKVREKLSNILKLDRTSPRH